MPHANEEEIAAFRRYMHHLSILAFDIYFETMDK